MATEVQTAPLLEQKFSRYRSVKKAAARKALASPLISPPASPLQHECTARSPSRYRRSRPGTTPPSPPSIVVPVSVPEQEGRRLTNPTNRSRTISEPKQHGLHGPTNPPSTLSKRTAEPPQPSGERQSRHQRHEDKPRREARQLSHVEAEPQRRQKQELEVENEREKFQRKAIEDGILEGLGEPRLHGAPYGDGDQVKRLQSAKCNKPNLAVSPGSVENKKTLRRVFPLPSVLIKCGNSSVNLPVTPTTTPSDLICSAANVLSKSILPQASVLHESFRQVGLERPLRKYEHVRDIMNSWDHDAQNSLLLVPLATVGDDTNLDVKSVPKEQPGDTSVYVYYSQKPGKWDKRWITLRSDGQVQVAKRNGSETTNICHISDFDIYTPTQRQLKRIRPPKTLCFAVKSQQKSAIFLSTANFVHFFATNDEKLAAAWYGAVQGWRSWYLVNVMGNGHKKFEKTNTNATAASYQRPASGTKVQTPRHQKDALRDASPDLIGSFSSLSVMDPFRSNFPPKASPTTSIPAEPRVTNRTLHARKRSVRGRGPPPVSFPTKLTKEAITGASTTHIPGPSLVQGAPLQEVESNTFASTGLLGRTYSHRQRARREREVASSRSNPGPFLPGLLNGELDSPVRASLDPSETAFLSRTMSIRSVNQDTVGLKRTTSQLQKPKPLVDLTPEFKEAPQHTRKGRGILPQQLPPGGLVDIATSPEVSIPIPPATIWQRPGTGNGAEAMLQRTLTTRPSTAIKRELDKDGGDAFTGGLLARTGTSQGGTGKGRGVVTGDRNAKGPMLDVDEKSQFAPGSLLAHAEQHTSSSGPVLEREKRTEIDVAVGEGI
ncbi:MAG: hypothetical protein M1830_010466 [Pleopsidium flavum]|nr:MAG: hypothetical protein M1830_010466 [Pleopsidium flavum]